MIPALFGILLGAAQPGLDVTVRLSSDTVLLNEPVWAIVTARNPSTVPLMWEPALGCLGTPPVRAEVTGAAPGKVTALPTPCVYATGGSCAYGAATTIAPGATATWEVPLDGDFHFDRPGSYSIWLTVHPDKPDRYRQAPGAQGTVAPLVDVSQTRTLVVRPRNDAALRERLRRITDDIEARMARVDGERRSIWFIRRLVAEHPMPGMEPTFERWLIAMRPVTPDGRVFYNEYEPDAILGLKNLNTAESRAVLARAAQLPSPANNATQSRALDALAELSDRQYYPLMVAALTSTDEQVRGAGIRGLGSLGGDSGVVKLLEMARTAANPGPLAGILGALSNSSSRLAVKGLIDLMAIRSDLGELWWQMHMLTHHKLPAVSTPRTPEQLHREWLAWWNAGGKDAPVYTRFDCAR